MLVWFARLGLARKLLVLVALPAAIAVGVLVHKASGDVAAWRGLTSLRDEVELGAKASALVHELQKERGMSAGYLGSGGANFAERLPEQRRASDAALAAFREAAGVGAAADPATREALRRLDELPGTRGNVDRLATSVAEMAGYYTPTIARLIDLLGDAARGVEDPAVVRALAAFAALVEAKERAGLERAMGSAGFGGGFSSDLYGRFTALAAQQEAFLASVARTADPAHAERLRAVLAGPETRAVAALREAARQAYEGEPVAVAPGAWFDTITGKIDRFHALERSMREDLQARSARAIRAAGLALAANGLFLLVVIFSLPLAARVAARTVIRPILSIETTTQRLAGGDLAAPIEGAERADELGSLARATARLRDELRAAEALRAEQRAAAERETERRRTLEGLVAEVGEVAAAAEAGDFGRRVGSFSDEAALGRMTGSINGLLGAVERGLGETRDALTALAEGDLSRRMTGDGRGAFAELRRDANRAAERLAELIGRTRSAIERLAAATDEVAGGSGELGDRAMRAAANVEETVAALSELTASVERNAEEARVTAAEAIGVRDVADRGVLVVARAAEAMGGIEESAARIEEIVGMIDAIAFQTNLLALNASVEAARAGEAGKGFAVVAEEVRGLAQRAADASGDIKRLVEVTRGRVDAGASLVREVGDGLRRIAESVRGATERVERIAHTNGEQSSALAQVQIAANEMDQMVQQNAALAERTNHTVGQALDLTNRLRQEIAVFRLGGASKGDVLAA